MSIVLENVGFSYPSGTRVLKGLSFQIREGEFFLVVGHNGAGKSTLLKLLNGILKPTSGSIQVNGLSTASTATSILARHICVTFQNPADQLFASTVADEVSFAPRNFKHPGSNSLVNEALRLCHLEHARHLHPYDLPLAQRKLLTTASALASGASFLAFDEPNAGLSQIEHNIMEAILITVAARKVGMLVVSHDLSLFFKYASQVIVLKEGECLYAGSAQNCLEHEGILRKAGLRLPLPIRINRILSNLR